MQEEITIKNEDLDLLDDIDPNNEENLSKINDNDTLADVKLLHDTAIVVLQRIDSESCSRLLNRKDH